jgi:hypothetical protein
MDMILPILCGVFILAALVALFMSRTTWPIYQIVLVFFLLLANVAFFYLAAGALQIQREWRNEVQKYETAYAQQYDVYKKLTGELDGRSPEIVVNRQEKEVWTIDDWKAELAEAMYGRGRVISTAVPKVDPASGALQAAAEVAVTLPKDSTVYVFQTLPPRERSINYKGTSEPVVIISPPIVRFVGAYVVTNVADRTIDLLPMNPEQKSNVNGPMMIYEVAPLDSHEAFAHLSEADIKALLAAPVPPEVVEQYLKDGKAADPAKDAPEHVWRRVRFTKDYTLPSLGAGRDQGRPAPPAEAAAAAADPAVEAPADAADQVTATEITFRPEDQAIFDSAKAAELVNQGVAEYVQSQPEEGIFSHVYMRPLVDYPAAFRDIRTQLIATNVKITDVEGQIAAIQRATQLAAQTEQVRKDEAERLKRDLAGFTYEATEMAKLHGAFDASVQQAHGQIATLAQSIAGQADELARLQLQAAQAAERRSTQPAATVAQ